MASNKYYNHVSGQPIDFDRDGCNLDEWKELFPDKLFAKHPMGFFIFLPPAEMEISDEYKEFDPYSVKKNLQNDFHRRKIECTLELMEEINVKTNDVLKILDIGCGQGHVTNRIHQNFPNSEISALDYSISAIEYAVEHFPGIDFSVGNAYQCPYSENYFDVVVCNNLWEHVPDPLALLKEITRILRPGGFIIVTTPSRYRLENLVRIIVGRPVILISKYHVTEYSVGQVVEQLAYGGYRTLKISSRSISPRTIPGKIAQLLFSAFISLTKSHHQLEGTVFYLAQRK